MSDNSPRIRKNSRACNVDGRRIDFEEVSPDHGMKMNERLLKRQRGLMYMESPGCTLNSVDEEYVLEERKGRKKNTMFKGKMPVMEKEVWESDDEEEQNYTQESVVSTRFARIRVKKSDCYYRSNLQTTVKEIHNLPLTKSQLHAIKMTPLWFRINAILQSDEETLGDMTKKYESDIRLLLHKFDVLNLGVKINDNVVPVTKRDLVLIFGVRDGKKSIRLTNQFESTPWMERCFAEIMSYKGTRHMPPLKKFMVYTQLKKMVKLNDQFYAQDVARLMHCYLLASLFMPNGNTSIPWCLCEYLEDFSIICTFDWSNLIVNQLNGQMAATKTMKFNGCAMLLPYWLCEHTRIVPLCKENAFPRFKRWNLNSLHNKLLRKDIESAISNNDILMTLKPTEFEKNSFRDLIAFQSQSPSKQDSKNPIPTYESNMAEDDDNLMHDLGMHSQCESEVQEKVDNQSSFVINLDDDLVDKRINVEEACNVQKDSIGKDHIQSKDVGASQVNVDIAEDNIRIDEDFNCSRDAFIGNQTNDDHFFGSTVDERRSSMHKVGGLDSGGLSDECRIIDRLRCYFGKKMLDPNQECRSEDGSADFVMTMEMLEKEINNIEIVKSDISRVNDENERLKDHVAVCNEELISLRMVRDISEQEMIQMKRDISALVHENAELKINRVDRDRYENEMIEMKRKISSLLEDNEELKSIAEKGYDSAADLMSKDLKCQIDYLKKKNDDLSAAKDIVDSELSELRIVLAKSVSDGDILRGELEARTKRMKEELEICERDKDVCIGNLQATVNNHLITIGRQDEVINSMKLDIAKLTDEMQENNVCGKISDLQNCLRSREYDLNQERKALAFLQQKIDRTNYELDMLKKTNEDMQEKQNCYTKDLEATLEEKNFAIQLMLRKHEEMTGTIDKLNEEKKDLERRNDELLNPSYTQIFNSTQQHKLCDLIAECNDEKQGSMIMEEHLNKLLEELELKKKKITRLEGFQRKMFDYNHNNVKLPEDHEIMHYLRDQGKSVHTPGEDTPMKQPVHQRDSVPDNLQGKNLVNGTIIEGVKQRTEVDDRNPKPVTPPAKAIARIVETDAEYPNRNYRVRWETKCTAVSKCQMETKQYIYEKESRQDYSPIWIGEGPFSKVYVVDALKVLHNESLSHMVVDSWGDILKWKMEQGNKVTSAYVFTSHTMDALRDDDKGVFVRGLVDEHLQKCVCHETLLFPIRNESEVDSTMKHWTMLKYSIRTAKWTYYNPLSSFDEILDMDKVNDLIKYVEERLRDGLKKAKRNFPLTKAVRLNEKKPKKCATSPEIVHGSLDSGVLVCHIIERLMKKSFVCTITKTDGVYQSATAGNYRCRMIESFIFPEKMRD